MDNSTSLDGSTICREGLNRHACNDFFTLIMLMLYIPLSVICGIFLLSAVKEIRRNQLRRNETTETGNHGDVRPGPDENRNVGGDQLSR